MTGAEQTSEGSERERNPGGRESERAYSESRISDVLEKLNDFLSYNGSLTESQLDLLKHLEETTGAVIDRKVTEDKKEN